MKMPGLLARQTRQKYFEVKVVFIKETDLGFVSAVRRVWITLGTSVLCGHL